MAQSFLDAFPPSPFAPISYELPIQPTEATHRSNAAPLVAVSLVAALAVSSVLVVALYYLHVSLRIKRASPVQDKDISQDFHKSATQYMLPAIHISSTEAQVFTYKQLQFATSSFSSANLLAEGASGSTYRAILPDGRLSAVKQLDRGYEQVDREFRVEVDLLSRLHSPYLLDLIGYCADREHRLLVYEYMPNGSLQHHIHPDELNLPPLDWGTRLRIALDAARGLEYLHELVHPPVIHRDFKTRSIVLDADYNAKVSDFGLAKRGSNSLHGHVSTRVLGTKGYVAPEYALTGQLTTKSDVYSFGVVLLELLTGRVPVDMKRPPGQAVLVTWAFPRLTERDKVLEMVDPALEGQYLMKELIQVAAIAAMCVQPEADYRPFMTDVVQSLLPLVKLHRANSVSSDHPQIRGIASNRSGSLRFV